MGTKSLIACNELTISCHGICVLVWYMCLCENINIGVAVHGRFHVDVRCLAQLLSTILGRGSLTELEAYQFDRLAGQ